MGKSGRPRIGHDVRVVNVKVPESSRDAWLLAAGAAGMDLSKWIRSVCDRAAGSAVHAKVVAATRDQLDALTPVVEPTPDTAHVKVRQPKVVAPSAKQQALKEFLANR